MSEIILFLIIIILLGTTAAIGSSASYWHTKYLDLQNSINQIVIKELTKRAKEGEALKKIQQDIKNDFN